MKYYNQLIKWIKENPKKNIVITLCIAICIISVVAALMVLINKYIGIILLVGFIIMELKPPKPFVPPIDIIAVQRSIVYILRHAINNDLSVMLHLPAVPSKGFIQIKQEKNKNVILFSAFYSRSPNAPEINYLALESIRQILNSVIGEISHKLVYEDGTFYVGIYIHSIFANENAVKINIILVNEASQQYIDNHIRRSSDYRIIGNNSDNENKKNGEVLYDDE